MSNEKILNQYHYYSFIFVCITVTYYLNNGSFEFFHLSNHAESYDSLAKSMMDFHLGVDASAINSERFVRDGKTFMYFGAFPAFLRMPLISLFPDTYGLWNSISRLAAFLISISVLTRLSIFLVKINPRLRLLQKQWIVLLSIHAFGFGSVYFNLTTHMSIFYEALSWGLCLSTISIYFLVKYLLSKDESNHVQFLTIFAILTGLTTVTRFTYAIPLILILSYFCIEFLNKKQITLKKIILCTLPFIVCLSFQLWSNHQRFGNILDFANFKYYGKWLELRAHNEKKYQEMSSIKALELNRIPFNFKIYFLPRENLFIKKFPYLNTIFTKLPPEPNNYELGSQVFPYTLIYTWSLIVAIFGFINIFFKSKESIRTKIIFLCFVLQCILILMYKALNHRYLAEFVPLTLFSYCYYVYNLNLDKSFIRKVDIPMKAVIVLLSISTTVLYSLHWRANNVFNSVEKSKEKTSLFLHNVNESISKKLGKLK